MKYDSDVVYIVYASDDRFAEILGVSLVSLYENNRSLKDIIVYILDSGISDENKKKIGLVSESYKRKKIVFIPAKNISDQLSMNVKVDRGSLSQYARLFISSDLPNKQSRVLYLDCDTIINQSIKSLWNLDLQGKTIGALMDAFSKCYRKNIGLGKNDIMFNSGVMLINLEQWRKNKIESKVINFIISKHGRIQQGDQGALNAVLSHDTYCFDPLFNSVTIFYDFSYEEILIYRKPPKFYTKKQIKNAVEKPIIIHFTTSFLSKRPWIKKCNHKYTEEWLKYKKMSPWRNESLWDDKRSTFKQKALKIYTSLPNRLAIQIAGVAQAYGRPIVNKIKRK